MEKSNSKWSWYSFQRYWDKVRFVRASSNSVWSYSYFWWHWSFPAWRVFY